jgi:hypothetical protein
MERFSLIEEVDDALLVREVFFDYASVSRAFLSVL